MIWRRRIITRNSYGERVYTPSKLGCTNGIKAIIFSMDIRLYCTNPALSRKVDLLNA